MHTTAHRIEVLTAIANDTRASDGERAAARVAIEIHQRRAAADAGQATPTPAATQPSTDVDYAADVLLVYQGEQWWLSVDGVLVDSWHGGGSIAVERDPYVDRYFGERLYHTTGSDRYTIGAHISCSPNDALRICNLLVPPYHGPRFVRVMIDHVGVTWLFAAVVSRTCVDCFQRETSLEIEFTATWHSARFRDAEPTAQRALATTPLALHA